MVDCLYSKIVQRHVDGTIIPCLLERSHEDTGAF